MAESILRLGAVGPAVTALQTALNAKLKLSARLTPDGEYGPSTRAAVLRFQRENWLVEDGEAGPATLSCLFDREARAPILHRIPFIAQPTDTTCWAASTAMVTSSTVGAVKAKTPRDMWDDENGLYNSSGGDEAVVNGRRYGAIHGLRCNAPTTWTVASLEAALERGPLMFDMRSRPDDHASGRSSGGHMIVVVGLRGDGDPSGRGTTVRIHDPWPPHRGKVYSRGYFKWVRKLPTMTYRVFERV